MTIEEAIRHCYDVAVGEKHSGECDECRNEHLQLAHWLEELVKLRGNQPPNAPLTLEELREMDGKAVLIDDFSFEAYWGVVFNYSDYIIIEYCNYDGYSSYDRTYREETYGKEWLAYRKNPEEGTL